MAGKCLVSSALMYWEVPSALIYWDVPSWKHHHGDPRAGPSGTYQDSFVGWL